MFRIVGIPDGVFSLLPIVTQKIRALLDSVVQHNYRHWQHLMLRQLKEENPEINSMLLDLAKTSDDPKTVVLAGYKVYKALELAHQDESKVFDP